jgi:two-component system response regulator FlrC
MSNHHILVVEENHKERSALCKLLEEMGYHVTAAPDGQSALKKMRSDTFQLIVSDFDVSGISGRELFQHARCDNESLPFLFVARDASIENAVEMMKAGALDFLLKPLDMSLIRLIVKNAFESNGSMQAQPKSKPRGTRIVTRNAEMLRLLDLARQVSTSKAPILIQGESGTGKELFARFIHENSSRSGPFVAVNCGALPESLLESELFGHEKGAFTGAVSRKPGKFELADRGTILLDEITEMAFHLQSKLLRVLQEHEIDRVGGLHPVPVDVRVIATTNREILEAMEKETFREDLFYRLNVIPIKVPPLRDRKADISLLASHFIEKYNEIDGRNVKSMTKGALERLIEFPFPGNVRELENIMERAVLLSDGSIVCEKDLLLEERLLPSSESTPATSGTAFDRSGEPLREVEKKMIFKTLDQTNGNRTHAAKILGISVRTLRNKLHEYRDRMDGM